MSVYLALLAALALERLAELHVSRRNAAWSRARGGTEVGRRHFRWMALAHAAFLPACAAEVLFLHRPFLPVLGYPMLALAAAAQGLRWWSVAALGRRWNVRVIVVPGIPAVASGPYRWIRHPNYLAVIVEAAAVPLVHSAWITAAAFSAANALLLHGRIRREEEALAEHTDWERRLGGRPRFLPRRPRLEPPLRATEDG